MQSDLSRIIDALPGLVWTALADGNLDFVNQRWCEYTGTRSEDASGAGWQSSIHPDDLPEVLAGWQTMLASGEPGEMEARLRRSDGTYRWFLIRTCPLTGSNADVVTWCGIGTDIEDRRRAEADRTESERRFRLIFDGLPALVTLMDPAGDLQLANRQVLEYFGATFEEIKGWENGASFHPDDFPGVLAAWAGSMDTGKRCEFEARQRRADGVYRWFRIIGFPINDETGKTVLWHFLQTDIDDARRAEALLAGEKQLLELVARGGSRSDVLNALCRLVESTAEASYCSVMLTDPSGRRAEHCAAPSLPDTFINAIIGRPINLETGPCGMATFLNEEVFSPDLTHEKRWPTWCPVALEHELQACWATPIISAEGKALGALVVYHKGPHVPDARLQNVIEQFTHIASIAVDRVQKDAALTRSEAFLIEAQRLSSTGSYHWNVATNEITWSEQLHRMFDFDPNLPVTIESIEKRVHPDDMGIMQDIVRHAQTEAPDFASEFRLRMPDNTVKYLSMVASAVRGEDSQTEYIGAIQDVTGRRLSEEALSKTRAELTHVSRVMSLGAVTASIAHEINQPLSGVVTNAGACLRMLGASPPDVSAAIETVRRTLRDGNRASDVITRLRALFSGKSAGAENVDLNQAAREVLDLSGGELRRNGVVVRTELAGNLPLVRGDRVQLQQVILNLLLNAVEAMVSVEDRHRQIVIHTRMEGSDKACLSVRDNGPGFDTQQAEKLFEPFYTTKPSGMGIGLSVSRTIVESHRGRLWAMPNDGPGATFSFSVPFHAESAL